MTGVGDDGRASSPAGTTSSDGSDGDEATDDPHDDGVADHDIRALDAATVQRIAAGEVVERPASVVKELLENSLDADASRVSVAVAGDGTREIRVRDDGVGMTESALRRAVEEHTTSKIRDIDDLEAGVGTLGFRGEALHTIGAVSRMTIRSKPRGGSRGTELVYEGGEVVDVHPVGCPEGTVVEVCDLFFNTPARRKFLKTESTEFDHVNTVVTQYALANPDVAVSLEHDDREVFATEGRGSRESAVLSVYGRTVAESMIEVDGTVDGVRVEGLVSDPETTRSTREYLSTFVNGRYVTSTAVREAVLDAYGGQLAPDRYPFVVLFVEVDPEAVDVNVHPRKMEVRFDDERGVRRAVREQVETVLLDHGLIRSSAARGRSRPDETAVRPEAPDDEVVAEPGRRGERSDGRRPRASGSHEGSGTIDDGDTETTDSDAETTDDKGSGTTTDGPEADAGDTSDPSEERGSSASWRRRGRVVDPHETDDGSESGDDAADPDQSALGASRPDHPESEPEPGSTGQNDRSRTDETDKRSRADETGSAEEAGEEGRPEQRAETGHRDDTASTAHASGETAGVVGPTTQRTLDGSTVDRDRRFDRLPRLRVLGQIHGTYVVAASEEGLVLVDQHAADERVQYERLRRRLDGETPTQALAEPVELELTAREAAAFDDYREALARVGFHAGRVDDRRVEVRTVPAVFDATLDPDRLRDALTGFVAGDDEAGRETVDAAAESLVADLACYPSITGNTSLTEGSVVDLLEALDACDNPYACPHGRPTIVRIDREEIEGRFERDYPGHGGRRRDG